MASGSLPGGHVSSGHVLSGDVWLGLGSNVGRREANLAAAVAALEAVMEVVVVSSVYETAPFGHADQPDFLNMVVRGRTALPPHALLEALQRLETELGRTATFRMGPRSIDLDILLYDDVVMTAPGLSLPHPGLSERPFVLVPLLEIDPDLASPVDAQPLSRFLRPDAERTVRRIGRLADLQSGTESRT